MNAKRLPSVPIGGRWADRLATPSPRSRFVSWLRSSSRRRQPRAGQRQHAVLNDQPYLRRRLRTGVLEVGHLPVTDLRRSLPDRPGSASRRCGNTVIDDDFQQPPGDRLRCLLASTFPGDPRTLRDPHSVCSMFSHAASDNGRDRRVPLAANRRSVDAHFKCASPRHAAHSRDNQSRMWRK
jgi:hypothetical protein